jgi:phosphoadenosine phosphosulfate reductase
MEGFPLHLHEATTVLRAAAGYLGAVLRAPRVDADADADAPRAAPRTALPDQATPRAVFSTSLGAEDQVITHLIASHNLPIKIITLDTGRLPAETYDVLVETERRYKLRIGVFTPEAAPLEQYIHFHGVNGFYESMAQRKDCCDVRKLQPLRRALAGASAWVTGLRAAQNVSRNQMAAQSYDAAFGIEKFNPLIHWSEDEVWRFVRAHDVPYNKLHDRGYPSIGCAPCTRAIQPGEDTRAGRWWWESAEHKECGLHARSGDVSTISPALPSVLESPLPTITRPAAALAATSATA